MASRMTGLAASALLVAGPAAAGPPLVTDDPVPTPAGEAELNLAFIANLTRKSDTYVAPFIDLAIGVVEDLEVLAVLRVLVVDEDGRAPRADVGDLALGAKWRFLGDDESVWQMAIAPIVDFEVSDRSVDRGVADGETIVAVPLVIGRFGEGVDVFGELGWAYLADSPDVWIHRIGFEWPVRERLSLLGELYGSSEIGFDEGRLAFGLGFAATATPWLNVLFSAGRDIVNTAEPDAHLRLYLGLQLLIR